jgi:protein-L-isoaspartate(D-aspartate) O-methyltransferase
MDRPKARQRMVEGLAARGVRDARVLAAMAKVPRHRFVEEPFRERAYGEHSLPIGDKQTISQPLTVARMTEALALTGRERVLEIGTGSGYQTAILAELAEKVYSLERVAGLAFKARRLLDELGYHKVVIWHRDGSFGWREEAPFDAILAAAAAPSVPRALVEQLAPGGRLVIPIGPPSGQELRRLSKPVDGGPVVEQRLGPCKFVEFVGDGFGAPPGEEASAWSS